MGEVYCARDTKLNRSVAIKVLPDLFASDADRLARFTREAQTLGALNHPHIAQVYGLEESSGVRGLVMELVEGEDLSQRIGRGPTALDEALPIAKQIAEALEAAHEQGIIHRDLKPANIKVRFDGTVKVLDFGLAKALEPMSAVGGSVTASPTITTPAMTQMGIVIGTAAYMSPEQAKARGADKRSDVWAFGCVFYELLTGQRAFPGEDVADTLASVLKSDPNWNALPSALPSSVRALIEGSLEKDRRNRIADISTALFVLNQPQALSTFVPVSQLTRLSAWRRRVMFILCVAIGVLGIAALWKLKPSAAVPVTRFAITLPQGQQLTQNNRSAIALSPDGTRVVYVVGTRLYLRSMSELRAIEISGTDGALNPVFSPDGQAVVFWASSDRTLKRIAVSGGVPFTICPLGTAPSGMTWDTEAIFFAQSGVGIMRVSPNGGKPEVLVGVSASEGLAQAPQMLPDSNTLLFTIAEGTIASGGDRWDHARVVAQSLVTGERKTLIDGGAEGRYVTTGHLVYILGGTLFAVPFNIAALQVTGGPVPVIEGVRRVASPSVGTAHFAFSNSGSLVYLPGPVSRGREELFLFDRDGGADALKLPAASYAHPRVSPDGQRLALETDDGKEMAISIYELSGTSSVRRLTFGGNNRFPVWSADGRRIVFQSDRDGDRALFWQSIEGGTAERLTTPDSGTSHVPESYSPTAEILLFNVAGPSTMSLWTLSVQDRKAMPFPNVHSAFPSNATFSPNGRWVAYQSGEASAGEATTFVEPFPPSGTKHQIARGGRPLWSRDGKQLFYVPAAGQFRVVTVITQPTFRFTNAVAIPRGFGIADPASPRQFDMAPDGRIIGIGGAGTSQSGSGPPDEIHFVLNWFEELRTRVPNK
jgi:serine/threonine-protein kinase